MAYPTFIFSIYTYLSPIFFPNYESNPGVCLEVKVKLPCVASVLLHAVAKMVVGLPEALSVSAFPARDLLVGILRSRIHSAIRETAIQNYDKELANEVLQFYSRK